jgi:hypothetical protein
MNQSGKWIQWKVMVPRLRGGRLRANAHVCIAADTRSGVTDIDAWQQPKLRVRIMASRQLPAS